MPYRTIRASLAASMLALAFAVHAAAPPDPAFVSGLLESSGYKRAETDLDGDGRPEAFVYLDGPRHCGSGGCDLIVLSSRPGGWRIVLRSTVTRLPIALLPTSNNGWRDIGVTVGGGGIRRPYMARLRFDGARYPPNPTAPPALPLDEPSGEVLIGE